VPNREFIKQRMEQTQALLKKLDQSLPMFEEVIEASVCVAPYLESCVHR
jgi:hypothetical protein